MGMNRGSDETNVFDLFTGREISIMEFDRRVNDHGIKPMPITGKESASQKRGKPIQKSKPLDSDGTHGPGNSN